MTILPYDTHLGRWQREKARAQELVAQLKNSYLDGNDTLPVCWNPDNAEREYTGVLAEMEKVMSDHKPKS